MRPFNFFTGIGIALGAAYFFDPRQGRRRRIEVAQRLGKLERRKARALHSAWEDARNRLMGRVHTTRNAFSHDDASDPVIEARVRAALGRVSLHPSAIEVTSQDGIVTLGGHILADEVQKVMSAARAVRGVESIDNALHVHESAMDLSLLQGTRKMTQEGPRSLRPGTALAVGVTGVGLAIYGLFRRGAIGTIVGAVGVGMAIKGIHDLDGNRSSDDNHRDQTTSTEDPINLAAQI